MPTPFTHLETAQRMLRDDAIPQPLRHALARECPAFLLGQIAADARTNGDLRREDTHFYSYDHGIPEPPWRVMIQRNPVLLRPHSPAQRAFVAGYVAHLTVDEVWSLDMLGPHFAGREWGPRPFRFLMLHILLIYMDERDYARLDPGHYDSLTRAHPVDWLPFMSDQTLAGWRDFIGQQIKPGGVSQTLEVFGSRIAKQPADLRAILDAPEIMQRDLWAHITPDTLAAVETTMYARARDALITYWHESAAP
jgi:hypothetical protein